MIRLEELRFAKGLDPIADAFQGIGGLGPNTVISDVVKLSSAHKAFFVLYKGVGTTGTATVTVQAADDASPTNHSAVAFRYRRILSTDSPGAVTEVAAAGFTTTAGSSDMYVIEVDGKAIAALGYKYVYLNCVQVVDSAVAGAIVIILVPRYADDSAAITA